MEKKYLNGILRLNPAKKKRWKSLSLALFFSFALIGWGETINAQTVQIGSGTETNINIPNNYYYNYNYSQSIYSLNELTSAGVDPSEGLITTIRYKATNSVSTSDWEDWTIFFGNTSKEGFDNNTDWVATGDMSQVFSGQIAAAVVADEWMEITLDTPFQWDGTSNLVIAVNETTSTYGNNPGWSSYTLAPTTGSKSIYVFSDDTMYDPANPPTATNTTDVAAQIQFDGNLQTACSGAPTTGDTTAVACDSFEWFGTTYTASGTATHVLTNAAGCDSTVTLTLTINTSATGTDTQTACGSFTWIDGVEYTASNNTAMYTIVGGAANGCDSIVTLDLTINQVATGTDVQASCGPFTWIDGVEYTATNNTAMHTIVGGAANGCDSIVTLNLTVDTEVSAGNDNAITVCKGEQVDLDTLLSADADAGGTWYNSMNTPLASSVILSSFTAGNYDYTYEVVGSGACPDQTAVITVTVDGGCTADVNEEILGNISVYPNPTTSVLNIVNPSNTSSLRIEMLDMNGRVVMVENSALNNATEATLTIDHLEKGIYTLRVYNNEGHKTFKIVKQ